jgi:integrase
MRQRMAEARKWTPAARDYALLRTLYHAGLRSAEAAGAEVRDLHFDRGPFGKIHVRLGKAARGSGPRPRWVPMLDGLDLVPDAHPHEALLGLLALLHGASSDEVRHLRADDVDTSRQAIRLGTRPHPVPLDPSSWQTLQRCLAHRDSQRTSNPHVIVTKGTKAGRSPASAAYFSHLLDECGVPPRTMRCTRLGELVNTIDPKLVAAAFGMDPEGVMFYLSDHVGDSYLQTFPGPEGEMIPGHG